MTTQTDTDRRNAETSAAEVAAFMTDAPGPYFAYHKAQPSGFDPITRLHYGDPITTWTGERLAVVTWSGEPFRAGFASDACDSIRQNFRAKGINGVTYGGTAYLSAGDYVRMRPVKA